jgi:catechol 2,3-dioxygenase-like lactoylglutathione lyase family enzyme
METAVPLTVTTIDHVSVLVTDLARSRHFYRDVLGLKEVSKPKTFDFKVLWFEVGNQQLHLLQKPQPDTRSPRHFALRVTDVQKAREHFRSLGVEMQETTLIPHCDRFFVFDPDGNRIEIIQWMEPYDPAQSGAMEFDQN